MALIETEGVETVPENKRTKGFWEILALWAGFSIVITNFLLGSLTVEAGLVAGLIAATISILAVGIIVYFGTKIAAKEGTAGTTAMRAPFGVQGRVIPATAVVIAGIGWFGVQTGIVAESTQLILSNFGYDIPFALLAAILGTLMAVVAVFGYRWIEWLNRLAVPIMTVLLGLVVYQIWVNYSVDFSGAGSGEMSFWAALNIIPAATAAYLIIAMDYGRYGSSSSSSAAGYGASVAWVVFCLVLAAVGIFAAAVAGTWNPVEIMVELGLGTAGLLLLVLGSATTNVTNVYISGIGLSQITGTRRLLMTTLAGLFGTVLAVVGIFSFGGIESFLETLTITLVPTTGILLVHYYVIEGGLDTDQLFKKGGKYWYLNGWNPTAVIAWAIGAGYAVAAPTWLVPALTSAVIAGIIYYGLHAPVSDRLGIGISESESAT